MLDANALQTKIFNRLQLLKETLTTKANELQDIEDESLMREKTQEMSELFDKELASTIAEEIVEHIKNNLQVVVNVPVTFDTITNDPTPTVSGEYQISVQDDQQGEFSVKGLIEATVSGVASVS